MHDIFCPATMCPLFAVDGSPWTGEKNQVCPQDHEKCQFWKGFGGQACDGCTASYTQVMEVNYQGHTLQIGPIRRQKESVLPKTFDCPREQECQWQIQSGDKLCPPRLALSLGIDPRTCAY